MKDIRFHENRDDDLSCMLACLRSVLEYLTGEPYSWEDVEQLTGFEGKPVWTAKIWAYLCTQGFDVRMIEAFDYERFAREGVEYLREYLKPEELRLQLENTDILKLPDALPDFLKFVNHEAKSPTLKDLDELLGLDYLTLVTVNSKKLNGKPGYTSHMILVHDKQDNNYIAHDPGLPGEANRVITSELLWESMGGENNRSEMTGVKKKVLNGES